MPSNEKTDEGLKMNDYSIFPKIFDVVVG